MFFEYDTRNTYLQGMWAYCDCILRLVSRRELKQTENKYSLSVVAAAHIVVPNQPTYSVFAVKCSVSCYT